VDVRFGAHSGLKSDITALPKSANMQHDGDRKSSKNCFTLRLCRCCFMFSTRTRSSKYL